MCGCITRMNMLKMNIDDGCWLLHAFFAATLHSIDNHGFRSLGQTKHQVGPPSMHACPTNIAIEKPHVQ